MKRSFIALIIAAIIVTIGFVISGIANATAQESISQSNSTNMDKQNITVSTWRLILSSTKYHNCRSEKLMITLMQVLPDGRFCHHCGTTNRWCRYSGNQFATKYCTSRNTVQLMSKRYVVEAGIKVTQALLPYLFFMTDRPRNYND